MSLLSRRNPETKKKWGKWISEVKAPLKAKICTWLAVEKKIVTSDRLQKCKFEEPIICLLCRENVDTVHPLSRSCHFLLEVWAIIRGMHTGIKNWDGEQMEELLEEWREEYKDKGNISNLPIFYIWTIWLSRNEKISNEDRSSPLAIFCKIKHTLRLIPAVKTNPKTRTLIPTQLDYSKTFGFFDRA